MKKFFLAFVLLAVSIFSSLAAEQLPVFDQGGNIIAPGTTPTNWTEFSFGAGDTTETITNINHASAVYFMIADSSMTGTDSIYIGIQVTLDNGRILRSTFIVKSLQQATLTTYVPTTVLPNADGLTVVYVFNPAPVGGVKFSGTFFVARLNGVNASTPYTPVTRGAYTYE